MKSSMKWIALSLCVALMLSLCACSASTTEETSAAEETAVVEETASAEETSSVEETSSAEETEESEQIANPWTDCATLEEAEKLAGFDFTIPDALFDGASSSYQAAQNSMIQVIYLDAEGNELGRIRKGTGSDDISGDYSTYETTETAEENGVTATLKLNGDSVRVLTWSADDYSYSVTTENGLTREEALAMVSELK